LTNQPTPHPFKALLEGPTRRVSAIMVSKMRDYLRRGLDDFDEFAAAVRKYMLPARRK